MLLKHNLNLINLGYNPWSKFWKRNQTITYLFSEKLGFYKILFLHSPVWLGDLIFDARRAFTQPQINNWMSIFPRKVTEKINAFTPMYLPYKNKLKFIEHLNWRYNTGILKHYIDLPFVLMINDPQADQRMVDELIERSVFTIFDWSDDFVEFSSNQSEREICEGKCRKYCEKSDIVITVNDKLTRRAKEHNKNAFTIRNATNYFTFTSNNKISNKIKQRVTEIGPLIVGYVGWLNSLRLDIELIEYIASNRKDISFVFMGPKSDEKPLGENLPQMANVHILPSVPYHEYITYISSFDLCILPNRVSAHTEGNDPIKIYDYLATGNPVVTTPTAGTKEFSQFLYIAQDKHEFLHLLDKAIREESEEIRTKRKNLAEEHSWQKRICEIHKVIMPYLENYSGIK